MKTLSLSFVFGFSMIWFLAFPKVSFAEKAPIKTSIEEIIQNPGKFYDEAVIVQGYVQEFLKKPSKTNAFYLLKGKYDGIIQVRVQYNEPSVGKKYIIEGTVYSGQNGSSVFIHQTSIKEIGDFFKWGTTPPPGPGIVDPPNEKKNSGSEMDVKFYILIGAIALIAIIIIILIIMMIKKSKNKNASGISRPVSPSTAPPPPPAPSKTPPAPVFQEEEYKTIKIVRDPSRTLKFIPGELEIISGDDSGKSFRLTGYPTARGSVVTLGTQPAEGDRKFAHILIDKKFRTVSRHQAEFIYKDNEQKLYIKNLSKTNLTRINDVELKPNEEAEITNGSSVTTGELTFRYTV